MDSQHNKILTVSLVGLMTLSVVLAWLSRDDERIVIDRTAFAVDETEKINRVTLMSDDTVTLAYDGSRWVVNNTWDADLQMIKVLMATLRQVEPHRPIAASRVDTVNAQLESRGTRVILGMSDGTQRSFFAGGNSGKSEAWFRNEETPQPYVVIIPGYRVYVSGIFELNASGWRNKRIFDFNWRNFKSLTASYPREPNAGLTVELKQRYFGIRDMQSVDTTRLNNYLDAVSLLLARRFVTDEPATLRNQVPVARIVVGDIANREYTLELFAPQREDDEVFGRLNDGQLVTFDRADIVEIVRRRDWFVMKQP